MTRTFAKRTFTMPLLLRSMGAALLYMPIRWIALVRPAIPRGLREEVFLGVTSVNDCRWCTWLHSGFALMHGVKLDELQSVLGSGTAGTKVQLTRERVCETHAQRHHRPVVSHTSSFSHQSHVLCDSCRSRGRQV